MQLRVKLLNENAKMPTLGHEGDLAYDLYASENVTLFPNRVYRVPTGIAVRATNTKNARPGWIGSHTDFFITEPFGLIVEDRSSMADKGVFTHGGVIDAGYRGEIKVLMSALCLDADGLMRDCYTIHKGDKFAQLRPVPVLTAGDILEIEDFSETSRGSSGFGSTGA